MRDVGQKPQGQHHGASPHGIDFTITDFQYRWKQKRKNVFLLFSTTIVEVTDLME